MTRNIWHCCVTDYVNEVTMWEKRSCDVRHRGRDMTHRVRPKQLKSLQISQTSPYHFNINHVIINQNLNSFKLKNLAWTHPKQNIHICLREMQKRLKFIIQLYSCSSILSLPIYAKNPIQMLFKHLNYNLRSSMHDAMLSSQHHDFSIRPNLRVLNK